MEKYSHQRDSFYQPSVEKFNYSNQDNKEERDLVSNGCVDFRGKIASKETTGGWKASPFIIVNEVAERLAFYAIGVNMVPYLVTEMNKSLPISVTIVTNWIGGAYVLTILGAFLADAYFGRFKTILIFSCIYALGMVLLTLSASIDTLRPLPCKARPCTEKATYGQSAFLYASLSLIALGTGGIKPCVSSFGADQFDESDEKEAQRKYAFFNWFFFAINMGALLAITVLVYVQDKYGWTLGFGIPAGAIVLSIFVLVAGVPFYRYQKPMGSPFTRFLQVFVAAVRNHFKGVEAGSEDRLFEVKTKESDIAGARKLPHTPQYRFLDKAAMKTNEQSSEDQKHQRWRLCTVTQVEELKSFVRIIPIWASTIALSISFAQLSTFFITQASLMDRTLTSTVSIPAGSVPIFAAVNALILVPIYERIFVPILRSFTGRPRGLTSLQRMGAGLFVSILAMASAAFVESLRRDKALIGDPKPTVFWLFPQFFMVGTAEVLTYVGQLEFFYDEATDGTRSISSAMFLSEVGIGSWITTAIVEVVGVASGGEKDGWLRNDLNKSRLDYFYWLLTLINLVNFFVYVVVAVRFKGRGNGKENGYVRDEPVYDIETRSIRSSRSGNNSSGRDRLTMIQL